ncbi:MAG: CaiB/BaiF CoA transferase family protein, partial [Tepidiformaceae bacterium]
RRKRGVAIDLRTAEGCAVAKRLAAAADVVVENFRPGVMDRLGLGFEALRRVNPRLVYAAVSGFGQTGPYRERAAVDAVAQAEGGTMWLNGEGDGPPLRVGVSIGDMVGGLYLALGVLGALRRRDSTGEAGMVDVSLMEAQMALCENAVVRASALGEEPTRMGSRHPLVAPFGPFATADGWMVVANVKDWELFCALLGHDEMGFDARFATNEARLENVEALEGALEEALRRRTTAEWLDVLIPAECGAFGRVNAMRDLFDDPQVVAREALIEVGLPGGRGAVLTPGSPIRMEGMGGGRPSVPGLGEDTEAVLASWAGFAEDEIAGLRERGVIA